MAGEGTGEGRRQRLTLERLVASIENSKVFLGAILVGSFAAGMADALSDLDLILIAPEGAFDQSWGYRTKLHITGSLASWDELHDETPEVGAHKWLTADLILVECLVATPSSGVRLAEPFLLLAGPPDLPHRIARQKAISRSTMRKASHPVERAYDELKQAVRGTPTHAT